MAKYSKELIWDYITGNDIDNIDDLENDYKFIMEVIKVTKDKNMYNLCSDEMKTNYELIKFMINTFKDDRRFVSKIANEYLEKIDINNDDDITRVELIIIMSNIFKDYEESDEAILYNMLKVAIYNRIKVEINLVIDENPDLKDEIGLGFSYIKTRFNNNEIINKYFASNYLNEIFYNNDNLSLEEIIHKRLSNLNNLKKYGIKNFILNYIGYYDKSLEEYIFAHIELIKDIEESINNIAINWDNYIDNILKRKNEIFFQEVNQLIEEYNVLFTYDDVCCHIDKLNIIPVKLYDNKHYDFIIEEYVDDTIVEDIDFIDEKKLSLNDYKCLKEIIKLAKGLFISDIIDLNDSYLDNSESDDETIILDFPSFEGHSR